MGFVKLTLSEFNAKEWKTIKKTFQLVTLIIISSLIFVSCKSSSVISTEKNNENISNTNISVEQIKNTELQSEIESLRLELEKLHSENEIIKKSIFNPSLIDSNIYSYEGKGWAGVSLQYSDYFKSMVQRVLFSADYINVEELPQSKNPIEEIKKSEDSNIQLLGITYNSPILSLVTLFPRDIIQNWFSTDGTSNYLYLKTINDDWYSYKVLDGHLQGDYRILSLLLTLINELLNEPA